MNPISTQLPRRRFIQTLGATALTTLPSFGAVGANERVRLGVIGCGGRGSSLAKQFSGLSDVEIVAVCDADTAHMEKLAGRLKSKPAQIQDYRKLLERDDIDGVIIASPNHWHALHTIHACQAGKDVYVEKPVTHRLEEAAPMIEAAEKHGRIVQAGTQNRSDKGLIEAFDFIHKGEIGKITAVRGLCYRNRKSIGEKRTSPLTPPSTADYDLWLGPAEDLPIMRPKFHYDWHWVFNTGDGDMGNQGPHETDLMAWVMGDPTPPSKVRTFGQRFAWNDAGNTPNILTSSFDLGGVPAIFEVNNMWVKPGTNAAVAFKGTRVGIIVTCEGGEFRGGRGGGNIYGPDGEKLHKFPGDAGGGHARNFIDAMKSRKAKSLRAQLSNSCASAALAHYSNISHREGAETTAKKLRDETFASSPVLLEVLDRQEAQLERWSIDKGTAPYVLGSEVTIDSGSGKVTSDLKDPTLVAPFNRKGHEIPTKV